MNFRDLIIVGVLTVLSFPILYFVMMLWLGTARIEFGPKAENPEEIKKIETFKRTAKKDSLTIVNSKTYQALVQERADVAKERERLKEQQARILQLQDELEKQKADIDKEKKNLEVLVQMQDSLELKKTRQLAKVYSAMRPSEAARVLETLTDAQAAKIIMALSDDRIKGKILGSLSSEKATSISKILGGK